MPEVGEAVLELSRGDTWSGRDAMFRIGCMESIGIIKLLLDATEAVEAYE
jgi:hypothetical protein